MVRVDRDLKRCYFYRNKVVGDVQKPQTSTFGQPSKERHENDHKIDIIPYNPHIRKQRSKSQRRHKSRRISWSREADRVRTISPRSEPEQEVQEVQEIYVRPRSFSEDEIFESKPYVTHEPHIVQEVEPLQTMPRKKKKKRVKKSIIQPIPVQQPDKIFYPRKRPEEYAIKPVTLRKVSKPRTKSRSRSKSKIKKENLIRQQRDNRYKAQKLEQKKKLPSKMRKSKSESNLRAASERPPVQESLMKKPDIKKKKKPHQNPPRWRDVGDRDRRQRNYDKLAKPILSDYYF